MQGMATKATPPPNKSRRDWRGPFLLALRKRGNIKESCEKAGISREHAYDVRRNDPVFRAKWDAALEDAVDGLENQAWKMAMSTKAPDGRMLKFLLEAHRPALYRAPKNGVHVGPVIILRPSDGGPERRIMSLEDLEQLTTEELSQLAGEFDVEVGDYRLLEEGSDDNDA